MPGIPATTLTNVNISDTFYGVLHAGGVNIPPTGQSQIYDGYGTPTALKLGANCNGATICGSLSATSLSATSLSLTTPILSSILPNVTPSVAGTYSGYLTAINVNVKGLVTSVSSTPTLPLPYKAYATVNYNSTYTSTGNQGTDFTIVGNNIQSIEWEAQGFYRVTFTTPLPTSNYVVILQNNYTAAAGVAFAGGASKASEYDLIVGHKSQNFFEFSCWAQEDNKNFNVQTFDLLVI